MLDHVSEHKSTFRLNSYFDCFPCKCFDFAIKTFIKMTSMKKHSTLEETLIAMNNLASNNNIIDLRSKSGQRTVQTRRGYKICLKGFSTGSHLNLTNLTKDANWAVARNIIKHVRNENLEKNVFCLSRF